MLPFQLLTVAGIWACRTRWSGCLAALVAVWPLDEYFREWHFDFAATALLVTGLAVALRGRFGFAGLLLGVGTAVKWTPGLAALTLLVWLAASGRLSAAGRHVQGFALGFVGLTLPFLAWSPGDVLSAYSKQGGRELMGESLPYLPLRWLGLADRVTDPWQTVTAPGWVSPAAITIQLALLAVTLAVAAAVRRNLRAGVAVAALAPVVFLLTNRIFSPQFLVLVLAAWCVAIALLARSAREQLFLGAAAAGASAANVFVFPYALSIDLWHASSAVLFAIALGVTGWLLIRAWTEEPAWGVRLRSRVVTPVVLKALFWGSTAALAWTHAGYPLAVAAAARLRPRPLRTRDEQPTVTVIVAAHDEETVIERRLENLLQLDYPPDRVQIVVASDASEDATDEIVERLAALEPRIHLLRCPRGGKVAAQNLAARESSAEIVAFSDANATWAPDALRKLVRNLADPEVGYVCGRLVLQEADGTNREGVYWRYETWLREQESRLGSITGGNGSIYALLRSDYVEVDPRFGHDLSLPYVLVQRGRRAVYDPEALAFEKPTPDIEDEYRRKVRMFEHCWAIVREGKMLQGQPPGYLLELLSHRHLRYTSGLLHLALLGTNVALVREGRVYQVALAGQLAFFGLAAARPGLARYYALVTWATVVSLANYLRSGVPSVWDKAEGTR